MSNSSLDTVLSETRDSLGKGCTDCCEELQAKIRKAPLCSVVTVGLAGYVASFLPIGGLLKAMLKVTFFIAKPALVIFGLVKLVECLRQGQCSRLARQDTEADRDPVIDSPVGPPSA